MGKTAVIIVDMLKDSLNVDSTLCMKEGRKIIPAVQRLLEAARASGAPVVFANDSFLADDFMFRRTGRRPHTLTGTEGAEVIAELSPQQGDIILPKRKLSAFFGTGLETVLRQMGVDTIAVAGITLPVCVMSTVLDGLSHDFYVILLEDCCATHNPRHRQELAEIYGAKALQPFLKVMNLEEFLALLTPASET